MIRYLSADYVLPITSLPLENGVVAVDENGVVKGLYRSDELQLDDRAKIEHYNGVIIPGFINAHCHIELSHMKGAVPKHTGLPEFLTTVMTSRGATMKEIDEAMDHADHEMYENGIVAVGDHANTDNSVPLKARSKIRYHTFVEIMGIEPSEAEFKLKEAFSLQREFAEGKASVTPHAPYSCSKMLFQHFRRAIDEKNLISIHNQESDEENKLFRYRKGAFLDFYNTIGKDVSSMKAQARNSIQTYLTYLPIPNRILLVHNTFTTLKDIDFVHRIGRNVVWCLCPKANLYIENTLPRISHFLLSGEKIVIGTDSLASNDTLSILAELKVLHSHFPALDFLQTIRWATLNGAEALGIEQQFGSIEVGKKPGVVLLEGMEHLTLNENVRVKRLA